MCVSMMIQYAFKKSQYAHKYLGYVLGEAMHKTKPKKTTYIARAVYIPRQDLKVNCVSVGLSIYIYIYIHTFIYIYFT